MESRSSESRSSYTPSRQNYSSSSESRSSESREVSNLPKQTNCYDSSSESRETSESRKNNFRYVPDSEYSDKMVRLPADDLFAIDDSVYTKYRGENIIIKREDVEAFKAKLTYPEDYEVLLDIVEQTFPDIPYPSPEIEEELQKRDILITELRRRVSAQKNRQSLSEDNEELNKILGLKK